uniref:Uncharacterized protein n=1 Tax=Anguilla anguilla TaxID=7936 RepID=A0A0E9QH96_ANGAN
MRSDFAYFRRKGTDDPYQSNCHAVVQMRSAKKPFEERSLYIDLVTLRNEQILNTLIRVNLCQRSCHLPVHGVLKM